MAHFQPSRLLMLQASQPPAVHCQGLQGPGAGRRAHASASASLSASAQQPHRRRDTSARSSLNRRRVVSPWHLRRRKGVRSRFWRSQTGHMETYTCWLECSYDQRVGCSAPAATMVENCLADCLVSERCSQPGQSWQRTGGGQGPPLTAHYWQASSAPAHRQHSCYAGLHISMHWRVAHAAGAISSMNHDTSSILLSRLIGD